MEEIEFVNGLIKKNPDCWARFTKPGSRYREIVDRTIDTLEKEFDLVGTNMCIDQTRREELFKVLCDHLKEKDCYYLKKYTDLPNAERPLFRTWLSVKAINFLYDKVVNVTQELLVKNLIQRKNLTTEMFFYGYKRNMSILPAIIDFLNKRGLLKVVNPKDISTITYSLFIERVNSFMKDCTLITYFYSQHFFDDAVDEIFGTDRHKLYKFLDFNNISEGDEESDALLQENNSSGKASDNDSENESETDSDCESDNEMTQSNSELSNGEDDKKDPNVSLGAEAFVSEDVVVEDKPKLKDVKNKKSLDENTYQCILQTQRMESDYNDRIFYSMVRDESDGASIDADTNKRIRDAVYQKMIDNDQETTVKIMKKHYEDEYGYSVLADMFNMAEGAIRTRISRGNVEFSSYLNNCPKDMKIDIVKQIVKK